MSHSGARAYQSNQSVVQRVRWEDGVEHEVEAAQDGVRSRHEDVHHGEDRVERDGSESVPG